MPDFPPPPPRRERKPTPWLKLGCLGCGGLALLFTMLVGLSVRAHRGRSVAASVAEAGEQGAAAGDTTDETGCVAAARAYAARVGLGFALEVDGYTQACLHHALPSSHFCAGVPRPYTPSSQPWRNSKCGIAFFSHDYMRCSRVMQDVQRYCAEPDSVRYPPADTLLPDSAALDSAEAADTAPAAPARPARPAKH